MGRETVTRSRSGSKSDDDIEKLITKVCTTFADQLKEELNSKIDKLDEKLNKFCESLAQIQHSVQINTKSIVELQIRLYNLEQRSKGNSLRICGLEESEDEDLLELLPKFISQKINLECTKYDIDYAFRLKKSEDKGDVPAPIIVNFISNAKRNSVYGAKKLLKGSSIAIFEDLTRSRYDTLLAAKKKYGKNMVWSSAGKIYVWNASQGRKMEIEHKPDAKRMV